MLQTVKIPRGLKIVRILARVFAQNRVFQKVFRKRIRVYARGLPFEHLIARGSSMLTAPMRLRMPFAPFFARFRR